MPRERLRPITRALQLFVLSSFAVAQPLLGLLAQDAAFFVARNAAPADVVAMVAAMLFLPPLLLFACETLAFALSARLGAWLHDGLVALLAATLTLPVVKDAPGGAVVVIALGLAVGAGFAVLRANVPAVDRMLVVLVFAPLVFVGAFFFDPGVAKVMSSRDTTAREAGAAAALVPVVLVVFDALPLTSLLDAEQRIDAARYPRFARLAQSATWFRNATTVDQGTLRAVPAILTGNRPTGNPQLPTPRDHPRNLFTLLSGSHALDVHEVRTVLAPAHVRRAPFGERMQLLASDLGILYLHLLLPRELARALPDVGLRWRGFAEQASESRAERFREFAKGIEPGERPGLHFIHTLLPHAPFHYLPSGASYHPIEAVPGTYTTQNHWGSDEALVWGDYQRHLLQLAFVDVLLGELLDHLAQVGLYDDALVIVTADHGKSFWPGESSRDLGGASHPEDILSVPLFVKRPRQTRGRVDRRNVELIDILPTIADLLDAPLAGETDGCSLFDPACPERPRKTAYTHVGENRALRRPLHFAPDAGLSTQSLERRLAHFGPGMGGLFRFGPYAELVGQPLAARSVAGGERGVFRRLPGPLPSELPAGERFVDAHVVGSIDLSDPGEARSWIALATDGVIQTVAQTALSPEAGGDEHPLATLLPEDAAPARRDALELFLVSGPPGAPLLHPIALR